MQLIEFYTEIKKQFPELAAKADVDQERMFGEASPDYSSLWFESLANAVNSEMINGAPPAHFCDLFNFMKDAFLAGDQEVKQCVDASFVENLFWQVSATNCLPFWTALPDKLKELYVGFHGHPPF